MREGSRCVSVNYSRLFGRKGLPEPEFENKQSKTNSITLFYISENHKLPKTP
jgi:hypothetical protein